MVYDYYMLIKGKLIMENAIQCSCGSEEFYATMTTESLGENSIYTGIMLDCLVCENKREWEIKDGQAIRQ